MQGRNLLQLRVAQLPTEFTPQLVLFICLMDLTFAAEQVDMLGSCTGLCTVASSCLQAQPPVCRSTRVSPSSPCGAWQSQQDQDTAQEVFELLYRAAWHCKLSSCLTGLLC